MTVSLIITMNYLAGNNVKVIPRDEHERTLGAGCLSIDSSDGKACIVFYKELVWREILYL